MQVLGCFKRFFSRVLVELLVQKKTRNYGGINAMQCNVKCSACFSWILCYDDEQEEISFSGAKSLKNVSHDKVWHPKWSKHLTFQTQASNLKEKEEENPLGESHTVSVPTKRKRGKCIHNLPKIKKLDQLSFPSFPNSKDKMSHSSLVAFNQSIISLTMKTLHFTFPSFLLYFWTLFVHVFGSICFDEKHESVITF